ncbi:hypothetical protein N658DRAFT_558936 [Parathielavia hyrcaniae]|uniref:Endonuclease/exonuclease/phosphatase domain-containing protein n=1 Tax=Parathielavia hyrcaniae TaxID=113614 RepID=A0AAN6Q5N5_9PEZI|nr:hypothetical protein N658DRAFT_558936 [Parathielavia hyrcaniae]
MATANVPQPGSLATGRSNDVKQLCMYQIITEDRVAAKPTATYGSIRFTKLLRPPRKTVQFSDEPVNSITYASDMSPAIDTWRRGELVPQPYFTFRDGQWRPIEPKQAHGTAVPEIAEPGTETPKPSPLRFAVLSWNIDFMRPQDDARMSAALDHLHSLVRDKPTPQVIMLNEMTASDLALIKQTGWVREGYHLTDASPDHWESPGHYGTTILVPHGSSESSPNLPRMMMPITSVSRLHYARTAMQRDALFIDIALPTSSSSSSSTTSTLRLCTTHLESLPMVPPKRPDQLAAAAAHLRRAHAGVLAGDLNAIEAFDRTLPAECGLRDAYLESGGAEGDEGGMTWGQMAGTGERSRFGLSRMDKVLFCGRIRLVGFERFGMDVVVEDEVAGRELVEECDLEKAWVTDHLGVKAEFVVEMDEGGVLGEEEKQQAVRRAPAAEAPASLGGHGNLRVKVLGKRPGQAGILLEAPPDEGNIEAVPLQKPVPDSLFDRDGKWHLNSRARVDLLRRVDTARGDVDEVDGALRSQRLGEPHSVLQRSALRGQMPLDCVS